MVAVAGGLATAVGMKRRLAAVFRFRQPELCVVRFVCIKGRREYADYLQQTVGWREIVFSGLVGCFSVRVAMSVAHDRLQLLS